MNSSEQPSVGQIIAERKRLFLLVWIGFVSVVFWASTQMTPVYEAKTVVLVEKEGQEQKISLGNMQNPFLPKADINSEYQVLKSRKLVEAVVDRLGESSEIDLPAGAEAGREASPVDWLLAHTKVRPLKGSDVVEIRARAADPLAVTLMANTYAEVYVERARERARADIRQVREFLADQVQVVRERLEGSESSLRDFQERSGVASLEDETRALVEQMATFESSYNHARADLIAQEEQLRLLRTQLDTAQDNLASQIPMVTGSVIQQLRAELADRMAYREKFLAQGYDVRHAKILELERQVGEIQARLTEAIGEITRDESLPADPLARVQSLVVQIMAEEVSYYALDAKVSTLKGAVDDYSRRLSTLPQKSYEMGQLAHNAEVDEKILAMLLQRFEEARIEEAGLTGTAQIIDDAAVPTHPVRPDFRLNLILAAFLGSLLAGFACLLAHKLHKRVRGVREAERLSGLPVLARIPRVSVRDLKEGSVHLRTGPIRRLQLRRHCRQVSGSGSLILSMTPWAPIVEAFRALRVSLLQKNDPAPKMILVTSPGQGDGKTSTACNLALVLASGGSRVLLVDADMRRPRIGRRFKVRPKYGLPELLAGECTLDQVIARTAYHGMHLIPTNKGIDNPHDLLTGPMMPRLLKELRGRYDHVIIDSPPMVPVVDTAVLSVLVDTTLLVVRMGYTECEVIPHATQVLRSLGVSVTGLVMNADTKPIGGKRYYHYYRRVREIEPPRSFRALPSGEERKVGVGRAA